ncbi:MAG TPA: hypothetical protein VGN16_08610 [Acidobacteriaceae bacterium]|jgi:hypothetical protein
MGSATLQGDEKASEDLERESSALALDPRWQLIERIVQTEPFQKSTRLPGLLLYLARHTIHGDRHKLTEQAIGQAVFGKRHHYNPAEDSAVRVYVRQLRLKLHEYYHSPQVHEELTVSIPKGGYALDFTPASPAEPLHATPAMEPAALPVSGRRANLQVLLAGSSILFLALSIFLGLGWYRAAATRQAAVPWPLSGVFHKGSTTTVVMADAGFALRMLGDQEVPLDSYIDHSYLQPILPKHMTENESIVLHYFDSTRLTSDADAHAAAALSSLAGPDADSLLIRSARDVNANDLTHGDFIFLGSKTSNPWVELLDARMNFQIIENGPHGSRYVLNRDPQAGEQRMYQSDSMGTLSSGEDYAVIALLPPKAGGGSSLVLEGVRMEGTKATIALLQSPAGRTKLQNKLASLNGGRTPQYFEAVLHAQSVAGATMSVDVIAARVLQ